MDGKPSFQIAGSSPKRGQPVPHLVIADDHPIFREGMRRIAERVLVGAETWEVGTAAEVMDRLERAGASPPPKPFPTRTPGPPPSRPVNSRSRA
jgi:hypothetical protein